MKKVFFLIIIGCFIVGCNSGRVETTNTPSNSDPSREIAPKRQKATTVEKAPDSLRAKNKTQSRKIKNVSNKECLETDTGDKLILEDQTFAVDFKPFEGSCFVTSHNPEYDDPPIGSEFKIYNDGKEVYKFDSRYHANAATCWVEAVAFEDLNKDSLIDIIVAGKCGAKSGEVIGNEVFANNGEGFDTNVAGNDELEKFNTIKEIAQFVKANENLFFR